MSKNRTILYGYAIQDGSIQKVEEECEVVNAIYEKYLNGISYKVIAEELTQNLIIYHMENYNWNKNIIARILKNESYKGNAKYPQVISEELFNKVQDAMKPYTKRQDNEIKKMRQTFVCGHCGNKVKRRTKTDGVERWYCEQDTTHVSSKVKDEILLENFTQLLNQSLIDDILYGDVDEDSIARIELTKLENELLRDINNQTNQVKELELKIIEITQKKYELLNDYASEIEFILDKLKIYKESGDISPIIELVEKNYVADTNINKIQFKNGICCEIIVKTKIE